MHDSCPHHFARHSNASSQRIHVNEHGTLHIPLFCCMAGQVSVPVGPRIATTSRHTRPHKEGPVHTRPACLSASLSHLVVHAGPHAN